MKAGAGVVEGSDLRRGMRQRWYRLLEFWPRAYCAWNRRFPARFVVDETTDLVIEGYEGSGNSFAREAVLFARPGARVASHLHSAAHVRRALHLGVPVLILLRPPADAIASYVARFPDDHHELGQELRRYERFYRAMLGMTDKVMFSRFEDTTSRLGDVLLSLNRRLRCHVPVFDHHDPRAVEAVAAVLDSWTDRVFGTQASRTRPLPSPTRRASATTIRESLASRRHATALQRCDELHAKLYSIAESPVGVAKEG